MTSTKASAPVKSRVKSRLDMLQDGHPPGALQGVVGRVRSEGKLAKRDRRDQHHGRQFGRVAYSCVPRRTTAMAVLVSVPY
jgi:hypothetical protein